MRRGGEWRGEDQQGWGIVGREGGDTGRKEKEEREKRACYLWLETSDPRNILPRAPLITNVFIPDLSNFKEKLVGLLPCDLIRTS